MNPVPFDFYAGKYRAFVRTGYRDGNNVIRTIDGNKYEFDPTKEPQETVLLDAANEFVDDIVRDATRYSNGSNYWRIENYILQKTWNYYTPFHILNKKISKGSATKIVLDMEGRGLYSTADLWVQLSRTIPTSWRDALENYSNHLIKREIYIHGTSHDLPRQIVEISLDDVNEPFHLSFMSADVSYSYVRYIAFNGRIEIID